MKNVIDEFLRGFMWYAMMFMLVAIFVFGGENLTPNHGFRLMAMAAGYASARVLIPPIVERFSPPAEA